MKGSGFGIDQIKQYLKRGWPPEKVKKRKKTFVLQLCSKEQFELKKAQWEVLHSKYIQLFGVICFFNYLGGKEEYRKFFPEQQAFHTFR